MTKASTIKIGKPFIKVICREWITVKVAWQRNPLFLSVFAAQMVVFKVSHMHTAGSEGSEIQGKQITNNCRL